MHGALQAFMRGLIDYAGLFPPAGLELDPAIRNYARYRGQAEAWMLGRFIIPAARLPELADYGSLFAESEAPFRFSLLLSNPDRMAAEMTTINTFLERHGDRVSAEVLETRLPRDLDAKEYLNRLADATAASALRGVELFLESAEAQDRQAIEAIAAFNQDEAPTKPLARAGFKLRCGGLEPAAFPSPARVTRVIESCRDLAVPMKCTAGLHHPMRHAVAAEGVVYHGFFNIFGAALLAAGNDLPRAEIEACLLEEDAAAFRFTENQFAWRDRSLSAERLQKLRTESVTSFGSCSFDDPRADLADLGLMD